MLKRQLNWLGALFVSCMVVTSSALAQQGYGNGHGDHDDHGDHGGHWVFLGDRHVDGKADRDNIEIKPGDKFRAIQFRVDGGMVRFTKVIVHFRNGTREELDLHANIPSGGRSGSIDLPGQRRSIQSVEMWYGKANWRTRPAINLYGML
jgi:hypothetical protein